MHLSDQKEVKLQIWDTAGQEKFRCITKNFYRDAQGLLIVFDLNDIESFKNVETWLRNLDHELGSDAKVVKYLVGNKLDLPRKILEKDAMELATKYSIPYHETSAKTGLKIEDMFTALAKDVYTNVIKDMKDSILDSGYAGGRITITAKPPGLKTQTKEDKNCSC